MFLEVFLRRHKFRDLAETLDPIFTRPLRPGGPGCTMGLFRRGRILYQRGYGLANTATGEPLTAQSIFDLASISKQFTAYAVYLLEERGLLNTRDPLRLHFPELPPLYDRIQIYHLIRHTSGIRCLLNLLFPEVWTDPAYPNIADPGVLLKLLAGQKELNFDPGSAWSYCTSGYLLLAELVRRVSGDSLRDFSAREIFGPLGMRRSSFRDSHLKLPQGGVTGYIDTPLGERPATQGPACPGPTDLWSCVEDLARWDEHLNSPGPIHRSARRAMFTSSTMDEGGHLHYGGGLRFFELDGHRQVGHAGSDPGFRTQYVHELKSGLAIVCLSNRESLFAWNLAFEAMRLLLRGGPAKKPGHPPSKPNLTRPSARPQAEARWKQYAGPWRVQSDGSQWLLLPQAGGLQVQGPGFQFDVLERNGVLIGQGIAKGSTFKFEDRVGGRAEFVEFKQCRVHKRLSFIGHASRRVPEARDYLGYYRSPETGLQRSLILQGKRLRVQYPFGPGSWLKRLGPDELLAENGARLLFERDRGGRVRALVVDAPMSRACRSLRLKKVPRGRHLFPLRDRALMDRTFHGLDVNDLLQGI